VLAGVFYNAGAFVQVFIVLGFFCMRAAYEYAIDRVTSYHFGSDALPLVNFAAVAIHEICLSLMLTNVKHPIVFVTLVTADILENAYCLWSLHRSHTMQRVAPLDENENVSEVRELSETILPKRTSSVYQLAKDLKSKTGKQQKDGMILFIAAILLQRELVEVMVPLQAMGILSMLYVADINSNSLTASWSGSSEYKQTLMYVGLDFVMELVVFVSTIFVLKYTFPNKLSASRILKGLIRTNTVTMFLAMVFSWMVFLCFQCFYFGLDITFRFEWVGCDSTVDKNTTWVGGFDWDC